ncbi:MAG: hypothetical protein II914_02945 [Clostridia bacterium]|nr:hypothetical protein [Clostridia bacterium]
MKRVLSLAIAFMVLVTGLLPGCAMLSSGSDYCRRFIDYIADGEFERAYDMIDTVTKRDEPETDAKVTPMAVPTDTVEAHDDAKDQTPDDEEVIDGKVVETPEPTATPTPSPTPKPTPTPSPTAVPTPSPTPDAEGNPYVDKTISRSEFVSKYRGIFEEMGVTQITYDITDVLDGDIIATINYTQTYHTEKAGPMTFDFEIEANRIENRWSINWSPSLIFPMMQWGDTVRVGTLQSKRGEILCDGVPYAQNVDIVTIFSVPSTIEDMDAFYQGVLSIPELVDGLNTEERQGKAALDYALSRTRNDFCKICTFFPDELTDDLKQRILSVQGLAIDTQNYGTTRYYPYGESLAHIVGYAGIVTKKELRKYEQLGDTRYNGDSWVGKYGLEITYEDDLTGTNGSFTYIQTSTGGSRAVLYRTEAVDGKDLHLTIIPEVQQRLDEVVNTVVYDENVRGCVVVLNPKTGAIQAMKSWPAFNLNEVARGMPEEEWEAMKNDKVNLRLFNRAVQGLYTPGSVFKLMTTAALLETNTMTENDVFPVSETLIGDTKDEWMPSDIISQGFSVLANGRPLKRTATSNRLTPMNLINSIIQSDNLYFAYAGLRLGRQKFEAYLRNLGWETPIEFEIRDDEGNPIAASPQIYAILKNDDGSIVYEESGRPKPKRDQNDYDLAVSGYGQGQLLVSPLQMACFVSAYANNGDIMVPYVVDSIWHADGTDYNLIRKVQPKVWKKNAIKQSTIDTVHDALFQVCQIGTARYLTDQLYRKGYYHNLGYTIIGKTGTAEITDDKSKELAWFVAWRDKEPDGSDITTEEARLVCVMLEINLNSEGKIPPNTEIAQMKFDIARCMLKDSTLNRFYGEQGKNTDAVQLMAVPGDTVPETGNTETGDGALNLEIVPPSATAEPQVYSLEVVG